MRVNENKTFYDVYVKNDYFYKKNKEAETSTTLDLSIDDYVNKIQASIPELKDISKGEVCIHILPESSTDKSSGSTEDVSDDIIGVTSTKFHFEGDEAGAFKWINTKTDIQFDKTSVSNLLDKIKKIYAEDKELGATVKQYADSADVKIKTKSVTTPDGLVGVTFDFASNFEYEIAELNSELKHGKRVSFLLDLAMPTNGASTKEMLEKLVEDMKQENSDTLLSSAMASKRLAYVFDNLQKDK